MKISSVLRPIVKKTLIKLIDYSIDNSDQIIHECIRLISNYIQNPKLRPQLSSDVKLPKYLILSLPFLSTLIVKKDT